MPRMPDKSSLAVRDPQAQYSIPSFQRNPIGPALEGLGAAASNLGGALSRRDREEAQQREADGKKATAEREQAEKYGYTSQLLQLEQQTNDHLEELKKTAQPGAPGFADAAMGYQDKTYKQFFGGLPDHLKPEMDIKLQQHRALYKNNAQDFED